MKVEVDRLRCAGHGVCAQVCPDVFHIDAEDRAEVVLPVVPEELRQDAREAAEACPEGCIIIHTD